MSLSVFKQNSIAGAVALAVSAMFTAAAPTANAWESAVPHIFSVNDILGDFQGRTVATDASILCLSAASCPDNPPVLDKSGVTLYPIDSEFGFYIVDFLGAAQKFRDDNYLEGYAGNEPGGGIRISDASTDTYKVRPPYGTWCRGLGGNTVKCETEHYTTMEHVLSCHEVIPYMFADPLSGAQQVQSFDDLIPSGYPTTPPYGLPRETTFDCALAGLDDAAYKVVAGVVTGDLLTSNLSTDPGGMESNDLTTILDNYAVTTDYTITLKDDGKPDYHWGTIIKRPNDVRMHARLDVPAEWTAEDAPDEGYVVTKARLTIHHNITNNPNDQIRPEDIENEAATGRKPSYEVAANDVWKSIVPCYEGDSDPIEEGITDAVPILPGTYLKNTPWAYTEVQDADGVCTDGSYCLKPQPISADLTNGFTNAYYTSINRDPFEWSYLPINRDPNRFNFVGCAGPADDPAFADTCKDSFGATYAAADLELVSGPRWRLIPNKFGQDLPGLEIPTKECSPPPFEKDNIKYNVGDPATTVINLLDWDTAKNGPSPLANSLGWTDTTVVLNDDGECTLEHNPVVSILNADPANNCALTEGTTPITGNGMPVTDGFDLSIYIKGDKKSVAIYDAYLEIEYEGEGTPPTDVVCGPPTDADPATDNAVFLWNDCTDPLVWRMRLSAGGADKATYTGAISSANGFAWLVGVRLETNDFVTPTPPASNFFAPITYALIVQGSGVDGLDFRVNNEGDGCFGGTTPDVPVYVGSTQVEIDAPFSLATFEACTP